MEKVLNIILMGPPAAGKGTQSEIICKEYNIPHISTGDMFRAAIANQTKLGLEAKSYISQGLLVPDSVTIGLVKDRLSKDDCKKGFLLDGFPRTVSQANALKEMLAEDGRKLTKVVVLVADDKELTNRIVSRRVCPKCGNSYNLLSKKPSKEGICDSCGEKLIQRPDDNEASFSNRLKDYYGETLPLVDFYKGEDLVAEVNALQDIKDVFNDIKAILDEAK